MKKKNINIEIGLNEKQMPESIEWQAEDSKDGQAKACKAMLLSLFDKDTLETLKIDLWTTDMQVMEMDKFFYQTFRALSDTYFRATQNKDLAVAMQQFTHYFGEKTGIISTKNTP